MAKVYIADKETLDNVKQDTNNIKENVNNVTNNVQYIKSQFPISGGTDWSKYKTLEKNIKLDEKKWINSLKDNNILTISGNGYIKDLIIYGRFIVTIYVDNKEIYKKEYSGPPKESCYLGLYSIGDFPYGSETIGSYKLEHSKRDSFYANLIAQPIFFESSVKVKITGVWNDYMEGLYFLGGIEK